MPHYSHLVFTAGISVFAPRNVLGRLLRATPGPLHFEEKMQNPKLVGGADEEQAARYVRTLASTAECRRAALETPFELSAEYSLAHALRTRGWLHPAPAVTLLHTATLSGRIAAKAVAALLEEEFSARCLLQSVMSFEVDDQERLREGLGAFMHEVVAALREVDPSYACFAPQGGYKVMASLGYVAGSFLGFPTAYLHEDVQTLLHVIPPIPVALLSRQRSELGLLAQAVKRQPQLDLLAEDDRLSVLEHPWLFEIADGLAYPNAFAEFLRIEAARVFLSPGACRKLREVHHAIDVRRRLLKLPDLVAQSREGGDDYDGTLYHERTFANLTRPANRARYHIWKAVGGAWYAAWAEREDGAILINRIWTDHDEYTQDAENAAPQSSRGLFDDPAQIQWEVLEPEESLQAPLTGDAASSAPLRAEPPGKDFVSVTEASKLRKELNQANRQSAQAMQQRAELRKTVSRQGLEIEELKRGRSVLQNRIRDLEKQLATNR